MDSLQEKTHLDEVSHLTMIHKVCQRIRSSTFNWLLNRFIKQFYEWGERIAWTAIDSSGFTSFYAVHIIPGDPGKFENDS
jgi:hypothetical protein